MSAVTVTQPHEFHLNLPSCGALTRAGSSVCWRVWAPQAQAVELVLFGMGTEAPRRIAMLPEPGGYHVHSEGNVAEGTRYAFRLDQGPERPDPASRWQPDGIHQPSAVVSLDRFDWSEGDWAGLPRDELVIYELHVGTFTPEGTFDAVIPRLEELRELGVTAISLMPVSQFPGSRSWGYDGVHPFAVQNTYGGPQGLQRLVNACHRTGLAVILDVVYNHLGPEGNYLAEFGPYFTDRYHTPWGSAINFDGPGSDPVRAFVLDNVRFWIREFRVDGLRLDAVHAIYDLSALHILREMKQAADAEAGRLDRPVHVIAESDLNDVRLIDPAEIGGYGLDAQWSDDFHHALHALLTGERQTYYADFGRPEQLVKALNQAFVYDGAHSVFRRRRHGAPIGEHKWNRFIISLQNHDQVGNRPRGERLSALIEPNQQRLAAGLLLLSPYLPLLFMGEEYGETHPFPYFSSFLDPQLAEAVRRSHKADFVARGIAEEPADPQAEATVEAARLSWSWPEGSRGAALRHLYYDLLAIRRYWLPMSESQESLSYLLESWTEPSSILRLVRTEGPEKNPLQLAALFNLSRRQQRLPDSERPTDRLLISSEAPRYGGERRMKEPLDALLPFEFWVFEPRFRSDA